MSESNKEVAELPPQTNEVFEELLNESFDLVERLQGQVVKGTVLSIENDLVNREDWQGWRIRATMQMLSYVMEEEAAIAELTVNMPEPVVRLIFDNGWQRRLFHMGTGGEPVG